MSTAPALNSVDYSALAVTAPDLAAVDFTATEGTGGDVLASASASAALSSDALAMKFKSVYGSAFAFASLSTDAKAVRVKTAYGSGNATLVATADPATIYAASGQSWASLLGAADALVTSRPIRWIRPRQVILRPAMTATPMVKPQ